MFIDFSFAHLSLSKSIAITTGNKLKVSGAQVLGESLKVRAKDLEISSRQDTANYKSKQKNVGGSLTVGTAGVSGSVNFGKSKVNSDYAAVKTQSGLFAGDGGYDVEVTNHTRLNGGIITSSKKAEAERKNRFSTGTLSAKDIANRSDYKGEGFSVDLGFSVNTDSKTKETTFSPSQPVVGVGSDSGSARSVTKAGINTANITITNKEAQSELNDAAGKDIVASVKTDRDSESVLADTGLANLFNAAEVEGNIASQIEAMKSLSRSSQKVKGIIERKEKELEKIKDKLSKEEYNRRKKTYENSRLLLNSLTNALGTPSNGIAGMAAQGISPYLANQIGEYFADQDKKGSLGHGLAHAVLGAAVAAVGGNDALTAGLTAGSAEVIAPLLSRFMYGTDNPENLTASQKKTLVSIASLAGLAVGSTTGNVNDLAATNTAAVNAIENNYLTRKESTELQRLTRERNKLDCSKNPKVCKELGEKIKRYHQLDKLRDISASNACLNGSAAECEMAKTELAIAIASYSDGGPISPLSGVVTSESLEAKEFKDALNCLSNSSCRVIGSSAVGSLIALVGGIVMTEASYACLSNPIACSTTVSEVLAGDALGGASVAVTVGAAGKITSNVIEKAGQKIINDANRFAENTAKGKIVAPIDFDNHILNTEVSKRGKLTGGHSIANGNVNVVSRDTPNQFGIYNAKISYTDPVTGKTLTKKSTMFPDDWSAERVKSEVNVAYQNKTVFVNERGDEMWEGVTPRGFTVRGYLEPKTTVFPFME